MKYRSHRGTLEESMETVKEFHSKVDFFNHLYKTIAPQVLESWGSRHYMFDERINWNTWIITINGEVAGFTDDDPDKLI